MGGVGDAPTTTGGRTPLPLTCVPPVSSCCSFSVTKRSPVAAPAPTEGSGAGGVGDAPTTAGGPTPLPLTCVPPVTSAAGNAAGIPSPREDVAVAAEVAADPDEDMGGMPSPRGAADAAGVAAKIPPPREDVAAADGSGAAPGEDAVDGHGREEVTVPPPQVGTSPWKAWRRYPKVQCAEYVAMPAGVITLWVSEEWSLPEFM